MRSAPRLAPAAPGPEDVITDLKAVRKLVWGGREDWWKEHAPELADRNPAPSPAELADAEPRANLHLSNPDISEAADVNLLAHLAARRRREGERWAFLLHSGLLADDALWEAKVRSSA